MEELTDMFQSLIPVHDKTEEYKELEERLEKSIYEMANPYYIEFLVVKYKKYMRYIDTSDQSIEFNVILQTLVMDFFNEYATNPSNFNLLACKSKAIDSWLMYILHNKE
jgi:hypothetical protein